MSLTITNFIGFVPHWETDHTETDMSKIVGTAVYDALDGEGFSAEYFTSIRPGENSAWNLIVIQAAQAWRDAGGVINEWVQPPATIEQIAEERDRRLASGFDYDFGDERGVHTFATTDADMRGWDEVTKSAQASINLGQPNDQTAIVTETGPAVVTAMEWQSVIAAAHQFRQPIWQASFAIQAMDPRPQDYTDNSLWPELTA